MTACGGLLGGGGLLLALEPAGVEVPVTATWVVAVSGGVSINETLGAAGTLTLAAKCAF